MLSPQPHIDYNSAWWVRISSQRFVLPIHLCKNNYNWNNFKTCILASCISLSGILWSRHYTWPENSEIDWWQQDLTHDYRTASAMTRIPRVARRESWPFEHTYCLLIPVAKAAIPFDDSLGLRNLHVSHIAIVAWIGSSSVYFNFCIMPD